MSRSRSLPTVWVLGLAVGIIFAPVAAELPAAAYVRKVTSGGAPYRWSGGFPTLEAHLSGVPGLTADGIAQAMSAATQSWTVGACSAARIDFTVAAGDGPPTANDGLNVIGARPDGWCVDGDPAPPATCNDPSAVAVTSVFAEGGSGRILGADTQLNTLTVGWAVLNQNGAPADKQDLQSVLTHELGHVLGLEHPCYGGAGVRANDDRGQPVPDCYGAPSELQQDTMFPSFEPGDVSRRTLSAENARAICAIYPLGGGTGEGQAGGCAIGGATPAPDAGVAVLVAILGILGILGILAVRVVRPGRGRGRTA